MMRYVKIAQLEKPVSVIGLGTATRVFTSETHNRARCLLTRQLATGTMPINCLCSRGHHWLLDL